MAEAVEVKDKNMKSREEALEEAKLKAKEYDYLRMSFTDFHGMPRARVVPTRHADQLLEHGWSVYEGAMYAGARTEIPDNLYEEHHKRLATSGNVDVIPDPSTLHAVPWAGNNEYKVGEVLCDLAFKNGTPLPTLPRFIAQKQLNKLDALGLKFMSSFELEFILEDRKTHEPVFDGPDIFSALVFGEHEKMLFQLDQQMLKAGVNCEMLQTEYAPGQFEVTMIPVYGIDGGDKAIQLKQGIKEIAHQYSLEATFMTKPDPNVSGSGAHFNFSIWNKEDGSNVFYDANDPHKLSKFAYHWIGGLMRHGKAIFVLQSPTVNCYRRLQGSFAPSKVFWGIENRDAALRIKVGSERSTYMENRLPSGSANHYLVLAATIAAGLDGVKNCIEPPKEGIQNAETLPLTLAEALTCLEEDKTIVEALGAEFVEWFCLVKRMVDLELLKDSDITKPDPDALAKERYMYNATI